MATAKWKSAKLDELGFVGRGKSRHRPRNAAILYGGSYPFFQTGDIKAANFYLTEFTQTYSEEGLAQSKLWKPGTLCITIAANIAESAILGVEGCFPDSVVGFIADPDKADVRFIKYYMEILKLQMQSVSRGTTQDNLSMDKLLSFDFCVPSLSTQRRIASILSAYDELIENNQRRIRILEDMARSLYREWFVHFRYPGHESVPLVDSPLGQIPQGWEVLEFRSVFEIKYGKTLPKTEISESGQYPVYGAGDVIGYYDKLLCPKKCALVTSRGNGSGTVWRTRGAAFVTNNSLIIAPQKQVGFWSYPFIELLLKHSNVMAAKTGSAQPQVTIENLSYVQAIVPPKALVEKFCAFATPIYEQVDSLFEKCSNLRRTRDLLLPRLLSGQINLVDADL